MKICLAFLTCLLFLPCSVLAQSACRQASARTTERREAFTVFSILLPSRSGSISAQALVPNNDHNPAGAIVFSLSRLVRSEPRQVVEMLPVAVELATAGRPTIMLQRTLTWPAVDTSVGQTQKDVLCAQQWLSTHTSVKPDSWEFIGPKADIPTFDQLHAVGDNTSMVFSWGFPLGGFNENENTDRVLRDGSIKIAALTESHE
jgi:hypothetical protein